MAQLDLSKEPPKRIFSIDAFRALTMLCMIFINDLSGVTGMPSWMDHAKRMEDSMGFADTIFPAFLFIVGLSIPLALDRKMQKGGSFNTIAFSILSRSFALIVMGFFHVNLEDYSSASILPVYLWEILITLAFFLIWLDYPTTISSVKKYFLIGLGWLILLLMAFLFNGGDPSAPEGMQPSWWGILGIIGWAYLVCASVYFLAKGKLPAMIAMLIVLAAINIVVHSAWTKISIWFIHDASSETLVAAGIVISLWYARMVRKGYNTKMWVWLFVTGCAAILVGLLIRPYTQGISKVRSTPAWIFICTGISILVFELTIWLVDFKGKKDWFNFIWPAGTSALTCYLIPYLQVGIYGLVRFLYPNQLNAGVGGFIRSWAVAFIIVFIGGLFEKKRLRLKI